MHLDVSHDPLICQLFIELFDPMQLRQFVHDWVGGSISQQLPGDVVSLEALAHGAVVILRRNGVLDRNLFRELSRIRPGQHVLLQRIANQCGAGDLDLPTTEGSTFLAVPSVRTPDYVVQQAYESLRHQRDVVREFVHHFSLPKLLMATGGSGAADKFTVFVLSWLETRAGEIAFPPVRNALQNLGLAIAGLSSGDEGLRAVSTLATFLMGQQIDAHVRTVKSFAALTEVQLYELVLRDVEGPSSITALAR